MSYTFGKDQWLKLYRKPENRRKIWIYVVTSDGQDIFMDDYKYWLTFQDYIDKNNLQIKKIGLQFKSTVVQHDVEDAEAVYVIKSVKGELHADTLQCYTLGLLKDGKVSKTFYILPSLVRDIRCVDDFEGCFKEAFVYNVRQGETV